MAGAQDRLISTPEVCDALGLSPRSVDKLVRQGYLTKVKVLRTTRYRLSEVKAIVACGTSRTAA